MGYVARLNSGKRILLAKVVFFSSFNYDDEADVLLR